MIQIKKTILTLALLITAASGAWAEDTYTITFAANGKTVTKENVALPVTYQCSYYLANSELDLILKELYGWTGSVSQTHCDEYNTPTSSDANKVVAGKNYGDDHYITINNVFEGTVTITGNYKVENSGTTYTLEISIAAPASSGPEVAWDNDKKTGTFTMPGGNVELEPEYYPQALLTAAPTAIDDVPATTDGAIVNAGTVKNIGETTTAQGTVMYYVSPSALDDAALLALAADAWTADVPTAESFTAAGTAHVYYYVRGNDGDTDDEIFSDGDILAANALTVTIADAPTYAVTFAEGIDEPTKWTASPNANVTKGDKVTVTYTGSKKVLGVKAEKKAAAPAEKNIKIDGQDYTVLNGETWKQFITRNQLSGWDVEQRTLYTWGVYIDEPHSELHVSSDGTNWTLLVLSSQDAPIDTDKQYKWVQIGGEGDVPEPF